jgi:hypothetical protein
VIGALRAACREYNAGRFFECHEVLEELLDDADDGDWPFLLGLIQVAVGYHKLTHGYAGGEKLLGLGLAKLADCPSVQHGIDVAAIRHGVAADLGRLADARVRGVAPPAVEPPRLLPARGGS